MVEGEKNEKGRELMKKRSENGKKINEGKDFLGTEREEKGMKTKKITWS